jgi:uncharacterized surface protein with fasciclin (FAS1) repeats
MPVVTVSILATLEQRGGFEVLVASIKKSGLRTTLDGAGNFTIFAPNDDAFRALPADDLLRLSDPQKKDELDKLLKFHMLPVSTDVATLKKRSTAKTMADQSLGLAVKDDAIYVEGKKLTQTDIRCSNGVIHVIDAVLMPSSKTVVAMLREKGFTSMAILVEHSRANDMLTGEWPLSVFAPPDASIPAGTVDDLLKPSNKSKLDSFVEHHLVLGRVYTISMDGGHSVKFVGGNTVTAEKSGATIKLGGATITTSDIECMNGVVQGLSAPLVKP